jgi:hypothetical protein
MISNAQHDIDNNKRSNDQKNSNFLTVKDIKADACLSHQVSLSKSIEIEAFILV